MNRSLDVDLVLREFYADDGLPAPDHVLDAVEQRIGRQRQRRAWRLRGRPFMSTYAKLALAAAAVAVVAVVGFNLLPRQPSVGHPTDPPASGVPSPTPASTTGPSLAADPLAGGWTSAPSTCADQNAALQRAGFTAAQLALGGWDSATCMDLYHGSVHRLRFLEQILSAPPSGTSADGTLLQLADGEIGWQGYYVVVDADTFVAGDGGLAPYITYQFTIEGDQLVIDMVNDAFPATSEANLWGDIVAQTVIYESGPFTREP